MSESLPAIGVITAATIKYALNTHADMLYGTLKFCMISVIAGSSIVSENITAKRVLLSIAKMNHGDLLPVAVVFVIVISFHLFLDRFSLVFLNKFSQTMYLNSCHH